MSDLPASGAELEEARRGVSNQLEAVRQTVGGQLGWTPGVGVMLPLVGLAIGLAVGLSWAARRAQEVRPVDDDSNPPAA